MAAFQALVRGEANEGQQKQVVNYVINDLCATYDLSYRPDNDRDTTFAEGKRFVGLQIVKLTKLSTEVVRKSDERRKPGG